MSGSEYGFSSRLLHRLALGSPLLARVSFDLEQLLNRSGQVPSGSPVFVIGLARAGTTVLMRALHETGVFRSLTYRDMPFVLMPCTWRKLSLAFQTYRDEEERAHGDRITVNFDSPEAFEEVFWRSFCGQDYIRDDRLIPHKVSNEIQALFIQFVSQVVASAPMPGQTRYLSKNNNNLLRMEEIRKALPNAVVIVSFRDPIQQSTSLLGQHRLFSERHRNDPFSHSYMRWLGHHEFGLTHKPFRFTHHDAITPEHGDPDDINYWVLRWCEAYEHILSTMPVDAIVVSYEKLCSSSENTFDRILQLAHIDTPSQVIKTEFVQATRKTPEKVDQGLLAKAMSLYERLVDRE